MNRDDAIEAIEENLDYCRLKGITQSTVSAEYATGYGTDYAAFIVLAAAKRGMEATEIEMNGLALTFRLRHLGA